MGDSRSLPRMTGSKLNLRRQTPSQTSSTNNSSADESTGPSAAYRKIVSRKSCINNSNSRPQSPPIRGACAAVSPTTSENESATELSQQLKRLGQYLERKEELQKTGDAIDSEVDEYLMNIRKALKKQ